jgi:hypothetical protein
MAVLKPGRNRGRRVLRFGALATLLCLLTPGVLRAGAPLEFAVKATYLYKFAPFVGWPAGAFPGGVPFSICVLGHDPFGAVLDDAVRGQSVSGRRIVVRRLVAPSETSSCQLLYIGRSPRFGAAEVLRQLRGRPVLTVTDEAEGVSGGIVHFVLRDGRVRFALDADAARQNGLELSSRLLALAVSVRRSS